MTNEEKLVAAVAAARDKFVKADEALTAAEEKLCEAEDAVDIASDAYGDAEQELAKLEVDLDEIRNS